MIAKGKSISHVTPCVGVWIETVVEMAGKKKKKSHPAWVCGLKLDMGKRIAFPYLVTPCVGVWIETLNSIDVRSSTLVTPCVGVWIETSILLMFVILLSHTLRGCVD